MSTPTPAELARIEEAIRHGQKIEALRLYRECTDAGLAEAKAAVESIAAKLEPGRATPLKRGETLPAVEDAIFRGQKILAIKEYREVTGSGLAEAKMAVEKLEAELKAKSPERFTPTPAAKGCLGIIAIICTVVVILLFSVRAHGTNGRSKTPKPSIPQIAQMGKIQVGYSTQEDLARKWGEGKTLIGGHPNSGRVWCIKGTPWRVNTDGFDYSERGLLIDELSLGSCADPPGDIPYAKLSKRDFCWLGEITLGMNRTNVLQILTRRSLRITSTKEGWEISARVFSSLTSIITPIRNWQVTLTFANDLLIRLDLGATTDS